jgi:two-component system, LytTR family, sensor kinase
MTGINTNLLHLLGFATGAALYAMLLSLALRSRRSGAPLDVLPFLTGALGLLWNVGSLIVHAVDDPVILGSRLITATSYSALGFLPAVVVHSVLRRDGSRSPRTARIVTQVAYGLSAAGTALQFHATVLAGPSSGTALGLLTAAFVVFAVPLLLVTRREGYARTWSIAALAIFAISGFHMSTRHLGSYPWPLEIAGHHASLPLAFAILFFDYRFAFADLFLKRGISLVALIVVVTLAIFGIPIVFGLSDLSHPATIGLVVLISVTATLAYPLLRRRIDAFVDRIVLRRTDYIVLRQEVGRLAASTDDPRTLLRRVSAHLAEAHVARTVEWIEGSSGETIDDRLVIASGDCVTLSVPVSEPPRHALLFRSFHGGRRILSDDIAFLESVALIVARRIDALRLLTERIAQGAREQEMSKLTTEAELRALRAQINPHFLFNALNTIGFLIRSAPERAFETLLLLTNLLRRVLRSSEPFVPLRDELQIVQSYLEIERARFEERLHVTILVPEVVQRVRIPTLLLQPLVENAIKHGISQLRQGGEIVIEAEIDASGAVPLLWISVRDSGAGATEHAIRRGRRDGLGLNNIEERLRAHYDGAASLLVETVSGGGTIVTITLPVERDAQTRRAGVGA